MTEVDDLTKIDIFREPRRNGLFCDLLWRDPIDHESGVLEQMER
jgi:serine/threonine-protein phosphatase 2B catalytic subunit